MGHHHHAPETSKMNAVDPVAWLTRTLERIANQ